MLVPGLGLAGVRSNLLLLARGDEQPHADPHQQDQQQAAGELGRGELGAEEDPEHDPDLETRLVEANMNAIAAGSPAPFWKVDLAIAIAA